MVRKRLGTGFYILLFLGCLILYHVYMNYIQQTPNTAQYTYQEEVSVMSRDKRSKEKLECCNGVLGYASNQANLPVTCPDMKCCNRSEIVAVIPIDEALGFRFRCLPKTRIRPVCYQPGTEVRSSNQDPDHIPRACCEGAKFEIELNKWYAAMSVKCVLR